VLIEDGKLNLEEFRATVPQLEWIKLPRVLGPNHTEYFYSAKFEDSSKIIKVIVRPSLWIAITESFKNRKSMDGSVPEEGYKGALVDWGSYIEAKVDENFIEKIKTLAKSPEERTVQTISW
jgi:hypothetical protein